MTIHLTCPNSQCAKPLRARDDQAGKLTDCPFCGTRMRIPRPDGPFVGEVEPETPAAPPAHVEEGEVLDWIGPPEPPVTQAAGEGEPDIRLTRPPHRSPPSELPPLTVRDVHEEGRTALNGGQAPEPAEADVQIQLSRVPVSPAPMPEATAEPQTRLREPLDEDEWDADDTASGAGGAGLKIAAWTVLALLVIVPFAYVLVQIVRGVSAGVDTVGGLLIVFGISLFALLVLSVATLWVTQRRLRDLEDQIVALRTGHESAHRELHEAVRDTHRRLGAPCPRCHERIVLTDRPPRFDCPACGLPLLQREGRLLDRRSVEAAGDKGKEAQAGDD